MTGENAEELASKRGGDKNKKKKRRLKPESPKPPESEPSLMSDITKTESEMEHKPEPEEGAEEPPEGEDLVEQRKKLVPLDRNKFGKYIVTYGVGQTFGEIALVHKDTFRNATVVADDDADLMVIDQDLFDRSLRAEQEARYKEIRDFIDVHPFFSHMSLKFKKLLEMSLRKETYIFDTNIIRQGDPVVGLHFIRSGGAQITIEPKKHKQQYLHMWPFEAGVDALSIEFEHLRELRRAAILRKYEDPSVWETMPEDLMIKRNEGYAAIEKHMQEKKINLCTVQEKEVLGDVETLLGLSTYMQTVRCTANTECFILDTKNFERLIGKKNNAKTTDIMRAYVIAKLSTRMHMRHADLIPLLGYLHQKLTEQTLPPIKKVEPFKTSKTLPDVNIEMQHLLQYFREGKDVMLIKPGVPGLVYYKELMHQKAQSRALQRKTSKVGENIKLGSVYKTRAKRKPRSMLQIRESLRQMMENELIEIENKKMQKKLKSRQTTEPNTGRTSQTDPTPRSISSQSNKVPKMPDESKAAKNAKPSLVSMMKNVSQNKGKVSPNNNASNDDGDSKIVKPVLITEIAKDNKDNQLVLPAIREEKTQEEIQLNTHDKMPKHDTVKGAVDKHVTIAKERSSDSSFKDEIPTKLERASEHKINLAPESKQPIQKAHIVTPKSKTRKSPKPITPQLKSPIPKSNNLIEEDVAQFKADVPKLPSINVEQAEDIETPVNEAITPSISEHKEDALSPHWQTAMTFVNERIQNRLMTKSLMDNVEDINRDYETSEGSMKLLESRIQAFHIKYGEGHKTKNLPHLRRYKLDALEDKPAERPKPGGKVWIKKKTCKFADTEFVVKDHKHVHYHMVDNIPQFENVKRTKAVMQQLLGARNYGDDSDYFEDARHKPITAQEA